MWRLKLNNSNLSFETILKDVVELWKPWKA